MSSQADDPWIVTLVGGDAIAALGAFCTSPIVAGPGGVAPWRRLEFLLAGTAALRDGATMRVGIVRFVEGSDVDGPHAVCAGRVMLSGVSNQDALERAGWRANIRVPTIVSVFFLLAKECA